MRAALIRLSNQERYLGTATISMILNHTKEEIEAILDGSDSIKHALYLLFGEGSRSYPRLHRICEKLGLEQKISDLRARSVAAFRPQQAIPAERLLKRHTEPISIGAVRRRVLADKLLIYECSFCKVGPEWRGAPMVLDLDHIDGDRKNNELSNLRFLCKNCHSQTETYGSRNHIKKHVAHCCADCGKRVAKKTSRCLTCFRASKKPTPK